MDLGAAASKRIYGFFKFCFVSNMQNCEDGVLDCPKDISAGD